MMMGTRMYPSTHSTSSSTIILTLTLRHHSIRFTCSDRFENCAAPALSTSVLFSTAERFSAFSSIRPMLPSICILTSSTCALTAVTLSTEARSSYWQHFSRNPPLTSVRSSFSFVMASTAPSATSALTTSRSSASSLNALRRGYDADVTTARTSEVPPIRCSAPTVSLTVTVSCVFGRRLPLVSTLFTVSTVSGAALLLVYEDATIPSLSRASTA
mmetsp:Transcript_13277/g.45937  ORF Transcript_13277/g.45937 Transcript_13277/m.45937 type:complete len:215 (+) Transcript_13277:665-1309(+)